MVLFVGIQIPSYNLHGGGALSVVSSGLTNYTRSFVFLKVGVGEKPTTVPCLNSPVERIPACHVGDVGATPALGVRLIGLVVRFLFYMERKAVRFRYQPCI